MTTTYASWTPELVGQLRDLAATGARRRDIAAAMGLTFKQVAAAGKRYGIAFHSKAAPRQASKPEWRKYHPRKAAPAAPTLVEDEATAIARFIAERGVTRCPPAFAGIVAGMVPDDEAARRLKGLKLSESQPLRRRAA